MNETVRRALVAVTAGVATAGALGLAGQEWVGQTSPTRQPQVTESGDITTICAPIGAKDDSYPGRWVFRFDHAGGWAEVPVLRSDFDRYDVGDWVRVQHRIGDLAVVSARGCAR